MDTRAKYEDKEATAGSADGHGWTRMDTDGHAERGDLVPVQRPALVTVRLLEQTPGVRLVVHVQLALVRRSQARYGPSNGSEQKSTRLNLRY